MSSARDRFPKPQPEEDVTPPSDEPLEGDEEQLRKQQLAIIKAAVEAGLFDGDQVLAEAVRRMVKRVWPKE